MAQRLGQGTWGEKVGNWVCGWFKLIKHCSIKKNNKKKKLKTKMNIIKKPAAYFEDCDICIMYYIKYNVTLYIYGWSLLNN